MFGPDPSHRFTISQTARGGLTIHRNGMTERPLFHLGGLVFNPAGAEAVRIRIEMTDQRAGTLFVQDGGNVVAAARVG